MQVEQIIHAHIDGGDGLLALIVRHQPIPPGLTFLTEPQEPLQLGVMSHPRGKIIAPHVHQMERRAVDHTGEVLIIVSGRVLVKFYSWSGDHVCDRDLITGDMIVLLRGVHGFEMLEPTEMIEVKQGPYLGVNDKIRLQREFSNDPSTWRRD